MSALKELRDTISKAKLKGHKVISLTYIDRMLSLVTYQSSNVTTGMLDALNEGGEAHESIRHHLTNRETDT